MKTKLLKKLRKEASVKYVVSARRNGGYTICSSITGNCYERDAIGAYDRAAAIDRCNDLRRNYILQSVATERVLSRKGKKIRIIY